MTTGVGCLPLRFSGICAAGFPELSNCSASVSHRVGGWVFKEQVTIPKSSFLEQAFPPHKNFECSPLNPFGNCEPYYRDILMFV